MVTSKWLYEDLPGSSMGGWEPELAQHLADPLGSQLGAPAPCPPALPRHRLAQLGCGLGRWGLIVLAACESN